MLFLFNKQPKGFLKVFRKILSKQTPLIVYGILNIRIFKCSYTKLFIISTTENLKKLEDSITTKQKRGKGNRAIRYQYK